MPLTKQLTIFAIFIYCIGYNCSSNRASLNKLQNSVIVLPSTFDSIIVNRNKNDTFLIYYFDGECSFCIAQFLDWLKKWQNNIGNYEINAYFISTSANLFKIEYFLEQYKLKLEQNQILQSDYEKTFLAENDFLTGKTDILLLDMDLNKYYLFT